MKHQTTFLLLLWGIPLFAQRQQGVYAELFGASTTVGVHYDTRFSKKTKWGARIGVAYTYDPSGKFLGYRGTTAKGCSFPLGINYLLGNRKHNIEIGVGTSYGIYRYPEKTQETRKISTHTGAFCFTELGYRFQHKEGFMLRIGGNLGATVSASEKHEVARAAAIYPYFSLGYNF